VSTAASAEELDLGAPPEGIEPSTESAWDVPGYVIIDADDDLGASGLDRLREELGAGFRGLGFMPTDLVERTSAAVARVSPGDVARLVARLRGDARIERVEPLAWARANFTPDDPLYKDQWHMERVGARAAWDYATGRGVTVAVVDTGIACEDHGPFTKGTDLNRTTCVGGWNFVTNDTHANDDQGHGSHVAGTIAQSTNNGVGATGLAFHAELMPVKVLNGNGWGTTADVADGIRWAADHGAHVINLSLGSPRNSSVLQAAIDHARSRGVVVVAAAGNSGGSVGFPGGSEGVIGVSATDQDDRLARFSSRGKGVDIGAPGVAVVQQTVCQGGKNKCEIFPGYNGTSMASPHVAGVAAMLVSQGVSHPDAVERILGETARKVDDSPDARARFGAGILDAASAVRVVALQQGLVRLAFVAVLTALVAAWARRKHGTRNPLTLGYALAALAAGPGLLFFAPLVLSRTSLPIDLLARPIADLDLYVGASLHRLLPLANVLLPFGLLAVTWQFVRMRPLVAGLAVGTAAYLGSILALGQVWSPVGATLGAAWCALNAVLCLLVARFALAETKP
jgi:serine protease